MSTLFNRGKSILHDFATGVFRIMLERTESTYTPDPDHDFVSELAANGWLEVDAGEVPSYARQTLANATITIDDANDRVKYDCDDVAFGNLEEPASHADDDVRGYLVYRRVGADDSTPADDELVLYENGKIDVVAAADAVLNDTTIWIEPLAADVRSGKTVDFGGGATGTLDGDHAKGARSLTIAAPGIAAAVTAGDTAVNVQAKLVLPAVLQNGPFTVTIDPNDGLITTK